MLPVTRSSRRFFAGIVLFLGTVTAVVGLRGYAAPYTPEAPAYRQKGPADAKVTIAEFSDFQCPACAAASGPIKRLQAMYPDQTRIVFKYMAWPMHDRAKDAAVAAECAGRQARFWDYGDTLFERQPDWGKLDREPARALFVRYAAELQLDLKAFDACLTDPAALAAVEADLQEAKDHFVNSTPTFFIEGERVVGARMLQSIGLNRVEKLLKK